MSAFACRSRPTAAPGRAQLFTGARAAPALSALRSRPRPRAHAGHVLRVAADGSPATGAANGSAAAVPITGVAVFSAAPYVHDFLEGACSPPSASASSRTHCASRAFSAAARRIWQAEGELHRVKAECADGGACARRQRRMLVRQRLVRRRSLRRARSAGRETRSHAVRWVRPSGRHRCRKARHHRRARAVVLAACGALSSMRRAFALCLSVRLPCRLLSMRWRCCLR